MTHYDGAAILEIIMTAVAALGVILQIVALVGILVTMKGMMGRCNEVFREAKEHALPAVETARHLFRDLRSPLKLTAANLVEVGKTIREAGVSLRSGAKNVAAANDHLLKKASSVTAMGMSMAASLAPIIPPYPEPFPDPDA